MHSDGSVIGNGTNFAIGSHGIWMPDVIIEGTKEDENSEDAYEQTYREASVTEPTDRKEHSKLGT